MSLSEWALIAEICGMVAVVISLIFVGLEIRNNTKQSQAMAFNTGVKFFRTIWGMVSTEESAEIFIKGINDFDELSLNEKAIFHSKMHEISIDFTSAVKLVNKGLLVDMDYNSFSRLYASLLLSPGVIRYLEVTQNDQPPYIVQLYKKVQNDNEGTRPMSELYKFEEIKG